MHVTSQAEESSVCNKLVSKGAFLNEFHNVATKCMTIMECLRKDCRYWMSSVDRCLVTSEFLALSDFIKRCNLATLSEKRKVAWQDAVIHCYLIMIVIYTRLMAKPKRNDGDKRCKKMEMRLWKLIQFTEYHRASERDDIISTQALQNYVFWRFLSHCYKQKSHR